MTGEAHWFPLLVVLLGGVGVWALVTLLARTTSFRLRERERIVCPVSHELADCKLVKDVRSGKWVELQHCSLPAGKSCPQKCVAMLNRGAWLRPPLRA